MVKTKCQGDAVTIVEAMDVEAYDMVVCCSGDGLAHEVFNGLGKRHDAKRALEKIAVTHVPCGSGNAMSCNLNGTDSASLATLAIIKGIPTPLDLISITQGETRTISFLSQSVGIVAEADLATEHLRWMGSARFTYGFLERLIGQAIYPCDIAVKVAIEDKAGIRECYRKEMNNHEPASERRGYKYLLDDDASASSGMDDGGGLPPLRYGTVNDKLPEGWEMVPYDKLGNFYCGNVSPPPSSFPSIPLSPSPPPPNLLTSEPPNLLFLNRCPTWQPRPIFSPPPSQTTATWISSASTAIYRVWQR